jgi:ABC-type Fe3+ transport system substrate-binding protein
MRRYVFPILFVVVLVSPFLLRLAMGVHSAAGSANGDEQLIIFTSHLEPIRREFGDAFSEWHRKKFGTGVFIDYRVLGSSDIVKYFDASKATLFAKLGTFQADLVWGGGDYLFDQQLKKPGYLQGVELDPETLHAAFPRPDLNGVNLYDIKSNPPQWFGTAMSSFGIAYNLDVDRYLGVDDPKTWSDLAGDKFFGTGGWLVSADPTQSSSAKQAYMTIIEKAMADAKAAGRSEDDGWAEGMGMVRLIAANTRLFTDSSQAVPGTISAGDAAAGMTIDFYGRTQSEAVGTQRMNYVEPAGSTCINPDPIAMVAGAEHRELAQQFIEYVLSYDGQKLWNTRAGAPGGPKLTSLRRLPVRPDEYDDMSNFTDQVDPFKTAGGFNKSNAREKTFPILGEIIEASCINLLGELRDTRAAIRNSANRTELMKQFGRFPFDQKEALRRGDAYGKASSLDRVRMVRDWTNEFREEYRSLREQAASNRVQTSSSLR